MRKYLVVAAIGAMLIAGQAAASDSAAVNADDRVGGGPFPSASQVQGADDLLILLGGAALIGLLAYGFSHGGKGHPASP